MKRDEEAKAAGAEPNAAEGAGAESKAKGKPVL